MESLLSKQVITRFIESGLSGAFSTAVLITYVNGGTNWEQLRIALYTLSISATIGFINGIIMAARKYFQGPSISVSTIPPEGLVE